MDFFSGPINFLNDVISARGNSVPCSTKNHFESETPSTGADTQNEREHGTSVPWRGAPPLLMDSIAGLDVLLRAEPVSLSRVSDEIRAHPDLAFMIMKLGESLAVPLDIPPCTIEEATIGLGTDRLRVLVYALSLLDEPAGQVARPQDHTGESSGVPALRNAPATSGQPSTRFGEAGNLEALYLAGFLHWLGLDSRAALAAGDAPSFARPTIHATQICGLTDVFMRDFITLIPFLEPALLNSVQKAASRPSNEACEKKAE
jgi:hypothetical protein